MGSPLSADKATTLGHIECAIGSAGGRLQARKMPACSLRLWKSLALSPGPPLSLSRESLFTRGVRAPDGARRFAVAVDVPGACGELECRENSGLRRC